ncbi:diguanylate cyclase with integral membrane sensor [Alkalidesulfovibrio alkalitolerans DSM 16529]|jgi:diguanylate cyclase (GGDEF)-like protein|uniref:diguanylate cyclase n=1 Tax=Alkalidesulfovibrio alkalitolerans DSM 16529 TaxID=1121439 RepID=S7UER4_9BACT|nr:sensor domain-containing diguanylate cyclase [Alkalidesulfovibrio alkalitolerans]EPR32279.1 diguanylate cyclase with integral membrane sensor [Alkalidesulfovibrio alkalitolerans DSM 16529]
MLLKSLSTIHGRIRAYSLLLVALPIAISLLVFVFFMRTGIIDDKEAEIEERLTVQAAVIDRWMRSRLQDAMLVASLPAVRRVDMEAMMEAFAAFASTRVDVSGVIFVGPDGRTRMDTAASPGLDVSDRAYFKEGREGRPFISDVLIGRVSDQPIIMFSAPVFDNQGVFQGVIVTPVRMTTVSSLLSRMRLGKTGESFLVTGDGSLLTELSGNGPASQGANAPPLLSPLNTPILGAVARGVEMHGPYRNHAGKRVVGAYAPLTVKPWILVGEIPESEVMGGARTAVAVAMGAGLLTILLLTPLLIRLARSIERPIERLVDFSESMREGEYAASCLPKKMQGAPDEVSRLHDSFCTLGETLRETIGELESISVTDSLTGLRNRRYLMQEGERLVARHMRSGQPLAALMLDIDHFKKVNDTHGHQTGDALLRHVSGIMAETVRGSDVLARIGGEEFCILAPSADEAQAVLLAERIRERVQMCPLPLGRETLACTLSIGVARLAEDVEFGSSPLEDALARADAALYEAKRTGRNRVAAASVLPPSSDQTA